MESGGKQVYTPHLKKVLKSYQAAATTSLHGPNSVIGVWPPESGEVPAVAPKKAKEGDPFVAPPPFPIQQPPVFAPADQGVSCEISETILESETISCFTVGGETRLCLPQILNTVLRDFSLQQINCVCDTLHIFCSRCTLTQIEALKSSGVLPVSAPSCGLITKTDAERLCAALLDCNPPKLILPPDMKVPFQLKVFHECFGKCIGLYTPDLYLEPRARCIECVECHGLLSPQKFVCHAHPPKENRTCHWGFDSFHWRAYILLDIELEENPQFKEVLSEMKTRFDFNHKYKRKQILSESCDPSKRVRVESYYPYPYALDPTLVYWYANPMWSKVSAFGPMPPVITKDGKPLYIPPEALPSLLKDRYEHHYQSNIAFTPASVQKFGLMNDQTVMAYHTKKAEAASKRHLLKKEVDYDSSSCCFDSEDTFSDTSFSTLSEKRMSLNMGKSLEKTKKSRTEECVLSNLEDDDDVRPSMENELEQLSKLLTDNDVEASLHTKIVSEVETIIAKYRKCLNVAVQGKKLYQMELEKIHHTQRGKLRRLKETNRHLEKEMRRLQASAEKMDINREQSDCQNSSDSKAMEAPPLETQSETVDDTIPEVEDVFETEVTELDSKLLDSNPTLPKLSPDRNTSPLDVRSPR